MDRPGGHRGPSPRRAAHRLRARPAVRHGALRRQALPAADGPLGLGGRRRHQRPARLRRPRAGRGSAGAAARVRADPRRRHGRIGDPPRPAVRTCQRPAPAHPAARLRRSAALRREHRDPRRRPRPQRGRPAGGRPAAADAGAVAHAGHRADDGPGPRPRRGRQRSPRPRARPGGGAGQVRCLHRVATAAAGCGSCRRRLEDARGAGALRRRRGGGVRPARRHPRRDRRPGGDRQAGR